MRVLGVRYDVVLTLNERAEPDAVVFGHRELISVISVIKQAILAWLGLLVDSGRCGYV